MTKFWLFFLKNRQFSYIILLALVIFGFQSLIKIPKESAPEVIVPVAVVTTPFPGASAIDVERLVTNKIEERLSNNLDLVDNVTSSSRDGVSTVVVEFDPSADIDSSILDTKDQVDFVKSELPTDAEDPFVSEVNFADQPVMTISISSELPPIEMTRLMDDLEDELKSVTGVSKIVRSGLSERTAHVVVSKDSLAQYNLSIVDIVNSLRAANSSLPIGSIELNNISYAVQFDGSIDSPEELSNVAITSINNQPIYLRDVATVINGVDRQSTLSRISLDGNPSETAVSISLFKRSGADVTSLSDDIEDKLKSLEDGLLEDANYLISFDTGEYVKQDITSLSLTAFQTIILVMVILFIALGWREALLAGLAIPLSFLVAFIGLEYSGNTINFVSLFSLILSVGILVDSAIVVTESLHTKVVSGKNYFQAGKETIIEFYYPLTTGMLTTIAVFAPLFLLSGIMGQFIASIPYTIIFVLLASLFVALGLVPLLGAFILTKTRKGETNLSKKQEYYTHKAQNWYSKFLHNFFASNKNQKRFFRGIIVAFFVTLTFPIIGIVSVIFFPQEDIDFVFISVEKPEGTTLEDTDISVREVEEVLYNEEYIDSFVTEVGRSSSFDGNSSQDEKLANFTILLSEDRKMNSTEIVSVLRDKVAHIGSADVRVYQPNNGPPSDAPVYINFFGEDLDDIALAIEESQKILEEIEGAVEINSSNNSDTSIFVLDINRDKASSLGVSPQNIAFLLRTALYGTEATTIKQPAGDIDVRVVLNVGDQSINPDRTNVASIDDVLDISIPTPKGPILLGSVVEKRLDVGNTVINHKDRERVGFLSSQVDEGANAGKIVREFQDKIEDVELPEGVVVTYGGETEDVQQSFKEMGFALLLGIILIIAVLVLQFSSFKQAFIIISIVPTSLIGVFFGLAISGKELSFPSMMGFIALSGIVVNNAIILIDTMNNLRKEKAGYPLDEIIIEAAVSRLRPILLTTLTTVIGVIPLTYAAGIWSPLAFAIMFGLSFAVIITLIFVPLLYYKYPPKSKEPTDTTTAISGPETLRML